MINRLEPPDLEVFRSNIGPDNPFPSGTRMPLLGVYCESTARKRQKLQVEDARKDPQWANSPTAQAGIFSYIGFPIFWPDGESLEPFVPLIPKKTNGCHHLIPCFKP
jgi:hypothetical protein